MVRVTWKVMKMFSPTRGKIVSILMNCQEEQRIRTLVTSLLLMVTTKNPRIGMISSNRGQRLSLCKDKPETLLCRRRIEKTLVNCNTSRRTFVVSKMQAKTCLEIKSIWKLPKWVRAKRVMARRWRRKKRKVARWILDSFSHFSWMNASKRGCSNNFFRSLSTTWNGWAIENHPRQRSTYHIYDGQFTVVITLLVKEKEVKVDNIVFLHHNTTEELTGRVKFSVWTCQANDAQSPDSFEGAAEATTDSAPTPCASLSAPSLGLTALCRLPTMVCISSELSFASVTTYT